jgi:N-dimethylarginine dimethylaminohydrolase
MTSWDAVIASIKTPPRRRDYAAIYEFYRSDDIPIWKWITADHFEGGDFVIVKPGITLLGWSGDRSTRNWRQRDLRFMPWNMKCSH